MRDQSGQIHRDRKRGPRGWGTGELFFDGELLFSFCKKKKF